MSSRAIVIVIAVVIIGFTLMSVRDYFTREPVVEVAKETEAPRILVAKRNLVSGAFIQSAEDLEWQPAPIIESKPAEAAKDGQQQAEVEVPTNNYQYEGKVRIEEFNGAVVRRTIHAGEPIVSTMLMKPGEGGFMSAVLEPGKRAVSISVNPISGNAGFVSPGDRVDLLITYRVKNTNNADTAAAADSIGTETFARNVRVLAVDQSLDNPENKAILAKTITVEVTPVQAEQVSVASELGKISVALVSTGVPAIDEETKPVVLHDKVENAIDIKNIPQPISKNYTMDADVSKLIEHKESSVSKVKIIRGDKVETLEFYQDKQ